MKKQTNRFLVSLLVLASCMMACEGDKGDLGPQGPQGPQGIPGLDGDDGLNANTGIELRDHSVTPVLAKATSEFGDLEMFSLFSSEDKLIESPSFTFGGSADGAGLRKVSNGYLLIVNNEDNYAVSRIALDNTFAPFSGEYVLNSDGAGTRVCSATLATPEEHGFGPVFLTAGESGVDSQTKAVDLFASEDDASMPRPVEGFGRWNAENAVPLPLSAYDKTVIVIGDDDSGSIGGGQVAMYVSETVGDLDNGKVYVLRRTDENPLEMDIETGQTYPVEFVEVVDVKVNTGQQNNLESAALNALAFGRVEDVDYAKTEGDGNIVYFNVTGQDGNEDRSKYGRVYRIVLNEDNPLEGTLELILDGDDRSGIAGEFQNPDNICVTENYVYIQEDPNGYGDETHDAYIYQYDIASGDLKVVMELRNTELAGSDYDTGGNRFGAWEYGAMFDISDEIGIEDAFILCIQPHTWRRPEFRGVDGGSLRPNENQGSQIVVIKGLPR
jgi:hypothetical protein